MGRNFGGRYERLFGRLRHGWKDTPGRCGSFVTKYFQRMVKVKVKQIMYRPGQALRFPGGWGAQDFMTIGTWRWSRLPALHTGRLYSPRKYSWYSFLLKEAESMLIGNRTRDLPACSALPQPTAPPRSSFQRRVSVQFCLFVSSLSRSVRCNVPWPWICSLRRWR